MNAFFIIHKSGLDSTIVSPFKLYQYTFAETMMKQMIIAGYGLGFALHFACVQSWKSAVTMLQRWRKARIRRYRKTAIVYFNHILCMNYKLLFYNRSPYLLKVMKECSHENQSLTRLHHVSLFHNRLLAHVKSKY